MQRHVKLYAPRKDGLCLAQHIEQKLDQVGGEWPDDSPLPELPEQVQYIWDWYWEIRQGVASGLNGAEPVSHTEMQAWAEIMGLTISPFLLRMFRVLDHCYLSEQRKQTEKSKPTGHRR